MADVIPLNSEAALRLQREADARELEELREWKNALEQPVLEIAHRLARAARIEDAAEAFVARVRERKAAGWHKVPMDVFEQLADALKE
jgi:hypothetical protein